MIKFTENFLFLKIRKGIYNMKKRILLIAVIAFTAVIFIHSSMSGTSSATESDTFFALFDKTTQVLHIPNWFNQYTIRKLAHFVEFSIYGVLLTATVLAFEDNIKKQVFKILFVMLAVPVVDEFIQLLSEGRNSQVTDVLLDFSGCVFGLIVAAAVSNIVKKRNKKKIAVETAEK